MGKNIKMEIGEDGFILIDGSKILCRIGKDDDSVKTAVKIFQSLGYTIEVTYIKNDH